ncbi:hypothetical protein ABKV19_021656 [Rosa sericea]
MVQVKKDPLQIVKDSAALNVFREVKVSDKKKIIVSVFEILTAHRRWHVFRGESSDAKDLLFSVKKSSLFQLKTELDVFLAGNTKEQAYDFKVKGSWGERSCTIYDGNNNIIAQMHKKHDLKSIFFGRDAFAVTVYPHVDYAFIVAIVVVLHEINMDRSGQD